MCENNKKTLKEKMDAFCDRLYFTLRPKMFFFILYYYSYPFSLWFYNIFYNTRHVLKSKRGLQKQFMKIHKRYRKTKNFVGECFTTGLGLCCMQHFYVMGIYTYCPVDMYDFRLF
jgi:hypothetical protein